MIMSAVGYDGPYPPKDCIGSRFAQYEERDGILCMVMGGDAVFSYINGEMVWIERWRHEPELRLIR